MSKLVSIFISLFLFTLKIKAESESDESEISERPTKAKNLKADDESDLGEATESKKASNKTADLNDLESDE